MRWQTFIYISSLVVVSSTLELVCSFSIYPYKATRSKSNTVIYQGRKINTYHSYDDSNGRNGSNGDNCSNNAEEKSLASTTKSRKIFKVHVSGQSNLALKRRQFVSRSLFHVTSLLPLTQFSEETVAIATTGSDDGCSNGSLAAEGIIPGAYQNMCMNLNERSFILKSTKDEIVIYQGQVSKNNDGNNNNNNNNNRPSEPSTTLAGRTGVALWNSGLLLARLLDEIQVNVDQQNQNGNPNKSLIFQNKSVLELGCGTGFASIVASKLGANYVYATDGNMEALSLAKANLERNGINPKDINNEFKESGEACSLQWGSLDAIDYDDVADVIIGSDLTYNSGHSGFNVAGEINGFLTVIQSAGTLEVVGEGSPSWPFPGIGSLETLLMSSLSEDERAIVKGTGGFKILVLQQKQRRRK